MTDLPTFSACTRSASFSTAKCADIVGLENVELVAELARAHRPLAQKLQHAAAGRIGKGFEYLAHDSIIS